MITKPAHISGTDFICIAHLLVNGHRSVMMLKVHSGRIRITFLLTLMLSIQGAKAIGQIGEKLTLSFAGISSKLSKRNALAGNVE